MKKKYGKRLIQSQSQNTCGLPVGSDRAAQNAERVPLSEFLCTHTVDHTILAEKVYQLLDSEKYLIAADLVNMDMNGQIHLRPQNTFFYSKEHNVLCNYRMQDLPNNKIQLIADTEFHLPEGDDEKKKELLMEYISKSMFNLYEVFYELKDYKRDPVIAGLHKPILHVVLSEARTWLYM